MLAGTFIGTSKINLKSKTFRNTACLPSGCAQIPTENIEEKLGLRHSRNPTREFTEPLSFTRKTFLREDSTKRLETYVDIQLSARGPLLPITAKMACCRKKKN